MTTSYRPTGLIRYHAAGAYRGYTLFSPNVGDDAYLVDMEGNFVHRWHHPGGIAYGYLMDNGNLLFRDQGSNPMGAVVGNFLFSSAIGGIDPATGQTPPGLEEQCRLAFANMKTLVENAGGSLDDIGSVKVYMRDRSRRDAVNRPWLEMFPDEAARPARHAIEYDGFPPGVEVQLEITAVLG